MPAATLVDISELSRLLASQAERFAAEVFPAGKRDGHEWRVGSLAGEPGQSLAVHLSGAKAGIWKDFASGQGGDLIDLAALALFAGDKRQALTYCRRYLGLDTANRAVLEERRAVATLPSAEAQQKAQAAEAQRLREAARRIWLAAYPGLAGTPVDAYLRRREINLAELAHPPRAIRFHPALWHQRSGRKYPAMVAAVTGPEGGFAAVHRTWLEGDQKAPIEPNKAVLGSYAGGHIALSRPDAKRLADVERGAMVDITEGIEDGLSVALIDPAARVIAAISLSNMGGIALPAAVTAVRLWRQADTKPAAITAADRAIGTHLAKGRTVFIPEMPAGAKDPNDVLRMVRA